MFAKRGTKRRALQAVDVSEEQADVFHATSHGRYRLKQLWPISPAELISALDRLNAYFDGQLYLKPLWSLPPGSGGGFECTKRRNRDVPGKAALRVLLQFSEWRADCKELTPRALTHLRLPSKPRRFLPHGVTFESDAGVEPWSHSDMLLVAGGLCGMLHWKPSGGLGQAAVTKCAMKIRAAAETVTPRYPLCRRSTLQNPLSALLKTNPEPQSGP